MNIYMSIYTTHTNLKQVILKYGTDYVKSFQEMWVLVSFLLLWWKTVAKAAQQKSGFIALVVQVTVPHRGKSGQELSQELGAGLLAAPHNSAFNHGTHSKNSTVETTQECCLGAHGPAYTQLGSFYPQDHLPSDGAAHMRWPLLYHSTVRKSPPQTCPSPAWSSQFLIGDSPLRGQIHSANQNNSVKMDVT